MAITKEVKCDKTEIVGDYKAVQCRTATRLFATITYRIN